MILGGEAKTPGSHPWGCQRVCHKGGCAQGVYPRGVPNGDLGQHEIQTKLGHNHCATRVGGGLQGINKDDWCRRGSPRPHATAGVPTPDYAPSALVQSSGTKLICKLRARTDQSSKK